MKKYIIAVLIVAIFAFLFSSCQPASTITPFYAELPITSDEEAKEIAFDYILSSDKTILDFYINPDDIKEYVIEEIKTKYDIKVQKTEDYYYIWFSFKEDWFGNLPNIKISTKDGKVNAFWSQIVVEKHGNEEIYLTQPNGEFCTELVDIN